MVHDRKRWTGGTASEDAEGATPIGDPEAASAQVRAWTDAGATWWIESMWGDYSMDDLRRRIEQGPPAV